MTLLDVLWILQEPTQSVEVNEWGVIRFAPTVFKYDSKKIHISIRAIKYKGGYYSGVSVNCGTSGLGFSPTTHEEPKYTNLKDLVEEELTFILSRFSEISEQNKTEIYTLWQKEISNI